MDAITVTMIVGLATLFIERAYSIVRKIHKSDCCGASVEMN